MDARYFGRFWSKKMIAEYKGKTYECSFYKGKIILISDKYEDGFSEDFDGYSKTVDRSECNRVYKSTPMVKYEGKSYYYYEETEDKIQLFVGASDLSLEWEPKGFKHTGYEEWTKWVPKSECEKFDEIIEY